MELNRLGRSRNVAIKRGVLSTVTGNDNNRMIQCVLRTVIVISLFTSFDSV